MSDIRGYAAAQRAYDAQEAPEDDDGRRPLNAADRRALAYMRARAPHLSAPCCECGGRGMQTCEACNGSGDAGSWGGTCWDCKGQGALPCSCSLDASEDAARAVFMGNYYAAFCADDDISF